MEQFNFAGFTWPRPFRQYRGDARSRLIAWSAGGKRRHTGPYMLAPRPREGALLEQLETFYLDSDFAPSLRWQWADEVDHSRIDHTGWFADEYGGGTIRGMVMELPRRRGFLAGWSVGEGMATTIDLHIWDDEAHAARVADSWAERVAEDERGYQAREQATVDIEDAHATAQGAREAVRDLAAAIRRQRDIEPAICDELRASIRNYRRQCRAAMEQARELRAQL